MDEKSEDNNRSSRKSGHKRTSTLDRIFRRKSPERKGAMEARRQSSRSSVDVRSSDFEVPQASEYSPPPPASSSRRRKFFSSFRKKFRSGKYKDKNSNIETLSASQPNIYRSVYRSRTLSTDDESFLPYDSSDFSKRSLDKSFSDQDVTPLRTRSRSSQRSRSKSDQTAAMSRSSEDQEEGDSGIAVIETPISTQVGHVLSLNVVYKTASTV